MNWIAPFFYIAVSSNCYNYTVVGGERMLCLIITVGFIFHCSYSVLIQFRPCCRLLTHRLATLESQVLRIAFDTPNRLCFTHGIYTMHNSYIKRASGSDFTSDEKFLSNSQGSRIECSSRVPCKQNRQRRHQFPGEVPPFVDSRQSHTLSEIQWGSSAEQSGTH